MPIAQVTHEQERESGMQRERERRRVERSEAGKAERAVDSGAAAGTATSTADDTESPQRSRSNSREALPDWTERSKADAVAVLLVGLRTQPPTPVAALLASPDALVAAVEAAYEKMRADAAFTDANDDGLDEVEINAAAARMADALGVVAAAVGTPRDTRDAATVLRVEARSHSAAWVAATTPASVHAARAAATDVAAVVFDPRVRKKIELLDCDTPSDDASNEVLVFHGMYWRTRRATALKRQMAVDRTILTFVNAARARARTYEGARSASGPLGMPRMCTTQHASTLIHPSRTEWYDYWRGVCGPLPKGFISLTNADNENCAADGTPVDMDDIKGEIDVNTSFTAFERYAVRPLVVDRMHLSDYFYHASLVKLDAFVTISVVFTKSENADMLYVECALIQHQPFPVPQPDEFDPPVAGVDYLAVELASTQYEVPFATRATPKENYYTKDTAQFLVMCHANFATEFVRGTNVDVAIGAVRDYLSEVTIDDVYDTPGNTESLARCSFFATAMANGAPVDLDTFC